MSRTSTRRTALLAVLAPAAAAGLIAAAAPASAMPFEGDPTSSTCLRVERLPHAAPAGSSLFVAHGYVLVLNAHC